MWSDLKKPIRPLFRAALAATERLWQWCFYLKGRLRRNPPKPWYSPPGCRVMVIAPHPDDETLGCGAAILRHLGKGDPLSVVFVTDGSASRALGLDAAAMRLRRAREAEAAMRILGVEDLHFLDLKENHWQPHQLAALLRERFRLTRPNLLYGPAPVDFHPEHRKTARAIHLAIDEHFQTDPPLLRLYQIQVPLTSRLINLVLDSTAERTTLERAFRAYGSQVYSLTSAIRLRRYTAAYFTGGRGAEAFWQLTGARFCSLYHGAVIPEKDEAWRGFRHGAFSDPLAFFKGRGTRKMLWKKTR